MTHGSYLSVAATFVIPADVFVLAVLSSSVMRMDGLPEWRAVALFWGCLPGTWLPAVLAAVAVRSIW